MYIYNCTTNISEVAHDKWLDWMRKTHIPAMLATGIFVKAILSQVLIKEELGGITYATQYYYESAEKLKIFFSKDGIHLEKEAMRLFPNQIVTFETKLKIIKSFSL